MDSNLSNHLINLYRNSKVNYNQVKESCEFFITNDKPVDVSIIIPVMNRETFHMPLIKHLKAAMNNYTEKTYSITFVEHCDIPKHKELSQHSKSNYIWIKKDSHQPFNKCLAMNVGALWSNQSTYYLFHDIDLLMDKNYFRDIFKNLERVHPNCALQTFAGTRILVMDQNLSQNVLNNNIKLEDLSPGINPPHSNPGAPGGSIFISRESFKTVGGYDPEFFHSYSPEDAFFFHKLQIMVGIEGCNDPVIEAYHMWHPYMGSSNPDKPKMEEIWNSFRHEMHNKKIEFINFISSQYKNIR